jgi:uncharacterized membrane protein
MSSLVVVAYPQEDRAAEVLGTLTRLERAYLADLDDAWYVSRSAGGRLQLHRPIAMPPPAGSDAAVQEMLLGAVCLAPLFSGCSEAGCAPAPTGIGERFMREIGRTLVPESSAIFAVIRKGDPGRMLPELAPYGGTVMQVSLAEGTELRPLLSADWP